MYEIHADEVLIGESVVIGDGVILQGRTSKQAKRIVIGDNVFIGENCRAYVDELEIGDYTMIHNHGFVAGDEPCLIGTCCWFGRHTIFNSTGGLTIGNGVGVGAYSQLWSHIRHGDTLEGCRFNSVKPLVIEDDVWFVGHCIVSPIVARRRSMAMVGSVVTRDMEENHVYAGVPAKDVTDKLGPQFAEVPIGEKYRAVQARLNAFHEQYSEWSRGAIKVIRSRHDEKVDDDGVTVFDVGDDQLLCMYLGAHGMYNAVETIMSAAETLRDRTDIAFIFVGDGDRKAYLQRQVREKSLRNVHFMAPIPRSESVQVLSAADVFLLPNRAGAFYRMNLPTKLFDFLASARPIVVAGEGESAEVVLSAGAGRVVPAEDSGAMARGIAELQEAGEAARKEIGLRARGYVHEHYSRRTLAERFASIVERAVR